MNNYVVIEQIEIWTDLFISSSTSTKMVDHILEFPRVIGFDELILSTRILINSDDVVMRYETKTIKK